VTFYWDKFGDIHTSNTLTTVYSCTVGLTTSRSSAQFLLFWVQSCLITLPKELFNFNYVQLVWQPAVSCKQTSNRLSNRFDNRFNNRVEGTATVRSTGCQTGLYNRFDNRLYTRYSRLWNRLSNPRLNVCIDDATGCQSGLTTGCIVYTNT